MPKRKEPTRLHRSFTPEFKRDAVRLVQDGKTLTEVAQNLGIARSLPQYWKKQLEKSSRLKKELRDAREERDILKEALAYFADDQKRSSGSSRSIGGPSE